MKKSFKVLLNMKKLNEKTFEFIKELEKVTQIENGQFVYKEEDEEILRELFEKYSPLHSINSNNNKN